MEWFAHRGAGKGVLENTLKGIQIAFDKGYHAVEFDVMLNADGVPILHHDWILGRCAKPKANNTHHTNTTSNLFLHCSTEQLLAYQVQEEPLPNLLDAIELCATLGMRMNIELKAFNPYNAIDLGQTVQQVLNSFLLNSTLKTVQPIIISSFYHACLLPIHTWRNERIHDQQRVIELALLYEYLPNDWAVMADALQVESVHLAYRKRELDAFAVDVRRIHTTGRCARVYTVNHVEDFQSLANIGVEGAFTDPNQTELVL